MELTPPGIDGYDLKSLADTWHSTGLAQHHKTRSF
jgi:hypothetical protein